MILRAFVPNDAQACFDLFRLAILNGAGPNYDAKQRAAWAGTAVTGAEWCSRLATMHTTLAEEAGEIVGFMSLRADGYLDLAFVHPDVRRTGLAKRLLDRTLAHAAAQGIPRLTTDASHLARRFLLKHGWQEQAHQTIERHGVTLENFRMSRLL